MTEPDLSQIDLTRIPADQARALIRQVAKDATATSPAPTAPSSVSGPPAAPPIDVSDSAIELELLTRHAGGDRENAAVAMALGTSSLGRETIAARRAELQREADQRAEQAWFNTPEGAAHAAREAAARERQ